MKGSRKNMTYGTLGKTGMRVSAIGSVMLQYSLLDRRPEETVLDLLHGAGVGVLVRGVSAGFAGG